ncbi:TetR/AcrR family transcriptional regulator [Jatrophihabitans sp. YIM 134969]
MEEESGRDRAVRATRTRILDVALEVLGQNPDAGMGEIATAAGVVRRTVYGHFPSRADLLRALAQQAGDELAAVLTELDDGRSAADQVWADYVARVWPVAARYRVLLVLRRSEYGDEIHTLLGTPENLLTKLVKRGQASGGFGRHLPPDVLSRLAHASVFTLADEARTRRRINAGSATTTSLLLLGVPAERALSLVEGRR